LFGYDASRFEQWVVVCSALDVGKGRLPLTINTGHQGVDG